MKYARFSKELGACHCSSSEKQKGGGVWRWAEGRRKSHERMEGYQLSPKELKGGERDCRKFTGN